MRYLILFLFTTTAFAGPFAEVSLSARQQYSQLPDMEWNYKGDTVHLQKWRLYDINETKNPYASIMVGYQWRLNPQFNLGLAIRHESSIATGKDRGINDLRLTLRWE